MLLRLLLGWLWRLPEKVDEAKTSQDPDLRVASDRLLADYNSNALAADKRYMQKVIRTAGNVHTVREELGTMVLYLDAGAGLVRCECSANERAVLEGLSRGQEVTIKGVVKGLHVGNIVVTGCRIIEVS